MRGEDFGSQVVSALQLVLVSYAPSHQLQEWSATSVMPTTAEPIFDGAEKKMSPSNDAVKINYIGDSGARVRLLAVRSTA